MQLFRSYLTAFIDTVNWAIIMFADSRGLFDSFIHSFYSLQKS